MKYFLFFLVAITLTSCSGKKEVLGPLSNYEDFQVYVFLSPYEKVDEDQLHEFIAQNLSAFGKIKYVENFAKDAPILFLSLGGYKEGGVGSVSLIGEVRAQNGFKTTCQLWKIDDRGKGLACPEIENGAVVFKNDQAVVDGESQEDSLLTAKNLILGFMSEYRKDNPKGDKPTFLLLR